ncbi:hypothetical protein [Nocardia sp. CC227C]|nr:hypothetical protein [Nocardia sp. CC227C]
MSATVVRPLGALPGAAARGRYRYGEAAARGCGRRPCAPRA